MDIRGVGDSKRDGVEFDDRLNKVREKGEGGLELHDIGLDLW